MLETKISYLQNYNNYNSQDIILNYKYQIKLLSFYLMTTQKIKLIIIIKKIQAALHQFQKVQILKKKQKILLKALKEFIKMEMQENIIGKLEL